MLFNKKQASQYLGISTESIDRYKDRGKLGYVRIGKRCLWTQALLDEFIQACTIPAINHTTPREKMAMFAALSKKANSCCNEP